MLSGAAAQQAATVRADIDTEADRVWPMARGSAGACESDQHAIKYNSPAARSR